MSKKYYVQIFYLLTTIYQTHRIVTGAPYDSIDQNAIIVIPVKTSEEQISKIESFKIDGETAIKQLTSRVSAEKILRTLSNVQEFNVLVEGLDAVSLGDLYKTAFPNGILNSISEKYLQLSMSKDNSAVIIKPVISEATKTFEIATVNKDEDTSTASAGDNEIQYDEVDEDDTQVDNEELKEEPITDDYVYDQPVEDRENVTKRNEEIENDYTRGSKNINYTSNVVVTDEHRSKQLTKYGESFRNWITKFLAG